MANMHWNIRSNGTAQLVALFSADDQKHPEVFVEGIRPKRESAFGRLAFIGVELNDELSAALVAAGYHGRKVSCHYRSPMHITPGEFRDDSIEVDTLLIVPETPAGVLFAIKAANARLNYKSIDTDIAAFMDNSRDPRSFSDLGSQLSYHWSKFPKTELPTGNPHLSKTDAQACVDFLNALKDFVGMVVGVCSQERFDAYHAKLEA
jgi:hypothetical protein